jgi:opacity protein-like surface antigen
MKKLALALVASTFVTGAASAGIQTGYYLGAALGYGGTTGKLTTTQAVAGNPPQNGSRDIGGNSANIGVHLGYGWVTGCFYFGGEFAYTFDNPKINDTLSSNANGGQMSLKRNGYFNAAFRGGYLLAPNTMFYVRLGGDWGKWTLTDSLNGNFTTALPAGGSKSRLSFAPGFGLETAVHHNVYVRVEYVYEFGPTVRAVNSAVPNAYTNVGVLRSQSGKMGLSYKF